MIEKILLNENGAQIRSFDVNDVHTETIHDDVLARRKALAEALRNGFISGEVTHKEVDKNSELDIFSDLSEEVDSLCAFIKLIDPVIKRIENYSTKYLEGMGDDVGIKAPSTLGDTYVWGFCELIDNRFAFAFEKMNEWERIDFFKSFVLLLKGVNEDIWASMDEIHNFLKSSKTIDDY